MASQLITGGHVLRKELSRARMLEQQAARRRKRRNEELDLEPEAFAVCQPVVRTDLELGHEQPVVGLAAKSLRGALESPRHVDDQLDLVGPQLLDHVRVLLGSPSVMSGRPLQDSDAGRDSRRPDRRTLLEPGL
jgi:hypothetical protein